MILDFIKDLYTANEIKIIAIGGLIVGGIGEAVGGFDKQFYALCILTIIDFITGLYAAWKAPAPANSIWSVRLYKGMFKKLSIYIAIAIGVLIDAAISATFCRYALIAGFAIMEAISIVENADRGGWGDWIPPLLRAHLKELQVQKVNKYVPAEKEKATEENTAAPGANTETHEL